MAINVFVIKGLLPINILLLRGSWILSRFRKTLQNQLNSGNSSKPSFSFIEQKVESNW